MASDMTIDVPISQEIGVQAGPDQLERPQLRMLTNTLYHHFFKMLKNKQDNNGGVTMHANFKESDSFQRLVMARIEEHFLDSDRTSEVDLDIVRFLANGSNFDTSTMTPYDRVKTAIMILELERIEFEVDGARSRRKILPKAVQKDIICMVCDEPFRPWIEAVFPPCRHVHCLRCIQGIRKSFNSSCSHCRMKIQHDDDVRALRPKYNQFSNVVCRSCSIPINVDVDLSVYSICGHVYHTQCIVNQYQCPYCPMTYNGHNKKKQLFVKFSE